MTEKKEFIKKWRKRWVFEERYTELTMAFELELDEIIDIEKNKHIHVAGEKENIDTCKQCGHDLRHSIHERSD